MNSILKVILLFGLLVECRLLQAQPSNSYYYLRFGPENGLPGTSIYGISQDEEGYLWIGTDEGIFTFDGVTFKQNATDSPIPSQLVDRVFHIEKDSFVALGRFPTQFYTIKNKKWAPLNLGDVSVVGIGLIHQAADKSICFRSNRGVYMLKSGHVEAVHSFPKDFNMYTGALKLGPDSFIISRESRTFFLGKTTTTLSKEPLYTHFQDFADSILLFGLDSLYSYKNGSITCLQPLELKQQGVTYSLVDRLNRLWFSGLASGLYVRENGIVREISPLIGIEGDYVTYLFKDRDDNIWISTASSGLFCLPKSNFTNYGLSEGLSSLNITDITRWRGDAFVGTANGLNRVNEKGIVHGPELANDMGVCKENYPFFSAYVFAVTASQGYLNIGAQNLEHAVHLCQTYPIFSRSIGPVLHVNDTIIAGGWGNLHSWKTKKFEYLGRIHSTVPKTNSKNHFLRDMGNGYIMAGESMGLFRTTSKLDTISAIEIDILEGTTAFFEQRTDKEGAWWFATNKGLLKRNIDKSWKLWTQKDGLLSNRLSSLEIDSKGTIWIGSDKGLNTFLKGKFSAYTQGSGLISNYITDLQIDDSLNVLWIGTNKGLSKLDLNTAQEIGIPSFPLYITEFEIVGDSIYQARQIATLEKGQNNLRINFSALNYVNPSEVQYQYRLVPSDTIWNTTDKNQAEFLALGPMDYTFEVRSRTPGRDWSDVARKEFSIVPPIWQTNAFTWLLMITLLALSAVLFRLRLKVVKQREQNKNLMLEKINHLEQQALSLTMNPHFIFNSLNSIQFYLSGLKNREATKYVADFAKLIRLNMDSSEKRSIALKHEIERLRVYLSLEKARFDKQFDYVVDIEEKLREYDPSIPNMVIQPLIENGIWHGILPSPNPGHISVSMRYKGKKAVLITVTDNGIGLSAAKKNRRKNHNSKGLSLTRERIKYLSPNNYLLLEELFDEEQHSLGTKATLYLELE